ncbi:MAG: hypothetical protein IJ409_02985 [Lachnospiraceae bacterium]|nr:hypothetical protein [Lachnospiraceae bacterium]
MEAEELLKKRFAELARKCYQNNQYTFTDFLSLADMAGFYEMEQELSYVPYTIWGGSELCERVMVRFGSEEFLGYEETFPITCLEISPLAQKFADSLSHRDFLGALMNLGIERSTLGDIFIVGNAGYLFCLDKMAAYIIENLTRVKHTTVMCKTVEAPAALAESDKQEAVIQIASKRVDGVIAKVYKLSRSDSLELFRQKKIFINGRLCENNSQLLKEQDKVSVRGYGKFEFAEELNISKKGKLNARVLLYGKK